MTRIKDAIYKCDFCGAETDREISYTFGPVHDRSIHSVQHTFGLCWECHRSNIQVRGYVRSMIMKFLGIS